MYKKDWGLKRICPMCSKQYYDLGRTELECPECGKAIEVTTMSRPRRGRKPARPREEAAAGRGLRRRLRRLDGPGRATATALNVAACRLVVEEDLECPAAARVT